MPYNLSTSHSPGGPVASADDNAVATAVNTTTGGIYNVKEFGASGNGTTDDTAAVRSAATAAAAAQRTNHSVTSDGRALGTAILYFPAGSYKITDTDALLVQGATYGRGYTIVGAGRETTQVLFSPATAKSLISNRNPGWMHITVRDMSFTLENANASFLLSDAGSPTNAIQNYVFERVNWSGSNVANVGIHLIGSDNNSEFTFLHCGVSGSWSDFFWSETSDQFVNYTFLGFQFEVATGNFVHLTLGGNVNVVGGSQIITTAGTLYLLDENTPASGVHRLHVQGARLERRTANAKIITCSWADGTVRFESVDDSAFSSVVAGSTVGATFTSVNSRMPTIAWIGCSLSGRHEYAGAGATPRQPKNVSYTECEILNFAGAADFVLYTDTTGWGVVGDRPVVHFANCRGSADATPFDTDLHWAVAARGLTRRRIATVSNGFQQNPYHSGTAGTDTEQVILPLGAVVVGARLYAPATGWSGATSTTAWTLTFKTTEATPTTIFQAAPGTLPGAGFNLSSSALWFICDSDAKRTINLVANTTLSDYNAGFIGYLEYIG